jgi:phosphate transport system ATP-binding protein
MSHISVRNLTVSYGAQEALRGVTTDIPDRQITVIIGPSGCGKTTLLKSLNRLTDLYEEVKVEGEVLIDGVNILDPRVDLPALRKKVGFLAQKPYPLPMSIYDNVAFGPRIHGLGGMKILEQVKEMEEYFPEELLSGSPRHVNIPNADVSSAKKGSEMDLLVECYLRLVGLWDEVKDRLRSPASRLSVGQQQRLALARTLAVDPEVILADEPTSALDPISAQLVEKQFQLLKKRYTIVVVTHILRQARRIADNVIFLYMGDLVEHGPAGQVFNSPRHERTKAYISGEIS